MFSLIEVPAAIFSQLEVQGWKLSWKPPVDCSTVLGPIIAKIKIRGISRNVKNLVKIITTTGFSLDLSAVKDIYGAEQYMATVYAVRNHSSPENSSAYQEVQFESPSKGKNRTLKFVSYYLVFL